MHNQSYNQSETPAEKTPDPVQQRHAAFEEANLLHHRIYTRLWEKGASPTRQLFLDRDEMILIVSGLELLKTQRLMEYHTQRSQPQQTVDTSMRLMRLRATLQQLDHIDSETQRLARLLRDTQIEIESGM